MRPGALYSRAVATVAAGMALALQSFPCAGQSAGDGAPRWVEVPGGSFAMGCTLGDADCFPDESPAREVLLAAGFSMLATEVTSAQYREYALAAGAPLPPPPGFRQGDRDPVVNVTWDEAKAYCTWLGGRLPSEAEWECAARGGRVSARFPGGDTIDLTQANFNGTGGRDGWLYTAPVASFPPNGLGLFDMAGNVWEWCGDAYAPDRGRQNRLAEPGSPAAPRLRVMRGGAFDSAPRSLRVSNRGRAAPASRVAATGFRCVREAPAEAPQPPPGTPPVELTRATPDQPVPVPIPGAAAAPALATPAASRRRFPPANAEMVWIPPGEFSLGCVRGDSECDADEQPRRAVVLSRGFWLDEAEVTVELYRAFCAATGSEVPHQPEWSAPDHPVVNVPWAGAEGYCRWAGGRLPTEAEWECAARGGVAGERFSGGGEVAPGTVNGDGVEGADRWEKTSPVGAFPPNGLGLRDMIGNVWEWCADWYDPLAYGAAPGVDPGGPESGRERVLRGASWTSAAGRMRISYRFRLDPADASIGIGFRCARPTHASNTAVKTPP